MLAPRLSYGDTIGMFCPSHVYTHARYERDIFVLNRLGFKVKFGQNIAKDTYGYAASAEERAADLNALVADDIVKMVMFGGGESGAEVLPYIDYYNIRRHPKLFSSYSDGTVIINAIHAQTGLVTYYGTTPGNFEDLRAYDWEQFQAHFMNGFSANKFISDSVWKTIIGGECSGTLIGGYSYLFALMLGSRYFKYDANKKYLLFIEDYERFNSPAAISTAMAFIEQNPFINNVTGLIFGHYSVNVPDDLLNLLARFGERHNIPLVYTDDFGHGSKHAILPIGISAQLDADKQTLVFH